MTEELLRLTVTENPYLANRVPGIWEGPSPRQYAFLTWPAKEILYGGAAGGGKSVSLLAAALQYAHVPGYAALLLRRTFADLNLPKALIPLSHLMLAGTDAQWNGQDKRWTFASGATLSFGYLDTELDIYRYQGAELSFIGFDEVTQFSEKQYRYLFSRLRKPVGLPVPMRIRAATNPGGIGHQWVYDRFINPKSKRQSSVFIPSKLEDNPWLDQASYNESLQELDHITREQLRHGNWDIRPQGNAFRSDWFRYYDVIEGHYKLGPDREPIAIEDCLRFATADIAGTEKRDNNDPDYTVVQVWDATRSGELILVHLWRGRFEIPDVEDRLIKLAWDFNVPVMYVEKNGIGLGVVQTVARRGLPVKGILAKRDKFARSQMAQIRMERGKVFFPKGGAFNGDFEAELLSFPMDGIHDDQVDAFSIAAQVAQNMWGPITGQRDVTHREAKEAAEAESERLESSPGATIPETAIVGGNCDDEKWLNGK
jgi:predicted phage terminase large subunit-like protein